MTDQLSTRFDHLLYEQLEAGNGMFVGEWHNHQSVKQSLTMLMPALHARGLRTLSVEIQQSSVDEMINATSTDDFIRRQTPERIAEFTGGEPTVRAMADLVRAAQRAGVQVLGHEIPIDRSAQMDALMEQLRERAPAMHSIALEANTYMANNPGTTFENLPEELRGRFQREMHNIFNSGDRATIQLLADISREERYGITPEGMIERDRLAADYIQNNRRGLTMVLGGSHHSSNTRPEDIWVEVPLAEGMPATQQPNPRANFSPNGYQGLDQRLGYVAIDYNAVDARGPVGQTNRTDGRFNNFEVTLPRDLRDMNAQSWPPRGGAPNLEDIYPPALARGPLTKGPIRQADPPIPQAPPAAQVPQPAQNIPIEKVGAVSLGPAIPPTRKASIQVPPEEGRPMLPPAPPRPMTR